MESHQRSGEKSHQRSGEKSHLRRGKETYLRSAVDSIKLLVIAVVSITALCFSYASFVVAGCIDTENQCLDSTSGFLNGLYISDNASQYAKLKRETFSESKGFEFMVWGRERIGLSKTLLELQHQRINLQPFNDDLWLELNYLNENARVDSAERSWALDRSDEIVGWNHEQRAKVIYYCVAEFEFYGQFTTPSCVKNLVHLPANWNLRRAAAKANLSSKRLQNARTEAFKYQKAGAN